MTADAATQKLYLLDPYTVSFEASLVACEPSMGERFEAMLDKSCFYPESGGQLADRGRIAGVAVTGVREDKAGRVYHEVKSPIDPGDVTCTIDWDTRFDHMQQHTGQHVLSRAFIDIAEMNTISFHMGDESCTVDLDGGSLDERTVQAVETLANAIIWENREIKVRTVSPLEVKEPLLRKSLPEGVDEVRLVEVDRFDVIGCCGTHVRRTGELGMIKVLKCEKAKGAHRVHFKVGGRALRDYTTRHDIVKTLANRFTTSSDSLVEKIDKLRAEEQGHRKEAQRLARKLAVFDAESLLERAENYHGTRLIAEVLKDTSEDYLKLLSNELKKRERTISILASPQGLVLCNASADVDIDFAQLAIERARNAGGSGGGRGGFAAVRLPEKLPANDFVRDTLANLKDVLNR